MSPIHVDPPDDATYDWLTWAVRAVLIASAGAIVKLWRDVGLLLHWRVGQIELNQQRDRDRAEILATVKRIEERQHTQGERVAHLEGQAHEL